MVVKIIQDPANRTVYVKLDHITRDIVRGIRQAYYKIGKDLKARADQKILEGPKSGRTYYRYFSKISKGKKSSFRVAHIASAPGEYPANWSGELRRSINYCVRGGYQTLEFGAGENKTQTGKSIGTAPYARYVELGTPKMAPRSYLRRAITETQGSAVQHFEEEIKKSLTRKD